MPRYRADLFDSFSEQPFGGSPAGIIYGAADLAASDMQKIAKEIGAPATCFVMNAGKQDVYVRFFLHRRRIPDVWSRDAGIDDQPG